MKISGDKVKVMIGLSVIDNISSVEIPDCKFVGSGWSVREEAELPAQIKMFGPVLIGLGAHPDLLRGIAAIVAAHEEFVIRERMRQEAEADRGIVITKLELKDLAYRAEKDICYIAYDRKDTRWHKQQELYRRNNFYGKAKRR